MTSIRRRLEGFARRAAGLLSVPKDNPDLNIAQFEAFSRQVPLLYFILITNMTALSWTHRDVAPFWVVVLLPVGFGVLCLARMIAWARHRHRKVSAEEAYRKLKATNFLASPIAIFCTGWSLALLPYGDAFQKAHVAFFMAITVIGIIFCLMHLRSAAFMVTVLVNVPFLVAMIVIGEPTFVATGINVALVTMAMMAILMSNYRNFVALNETKRTLLLQQEALHQQNHAVIALSDENLRLANLDSLTMLGNRRSFFQALEHAFSEAQEKGERLAVGVIDLDGFKPINDMYGHAAGDKVLIEVALRLSELSRDGLSVYRLGGDEFAVLKVGAGNDGDLEATGEMLCQALGDRINVGSGVVQVTGSLGFAVHPDVGLSGQDLYECADYALYAAKRYRRAGVVLFNAAQARTLDRQKRVEEVLLAADLERELDLAYQPIFDVKLEECVGFEALARWSNPVLGQVPPAEFIPIAEHNGRISLITRTLLKRALETAKHWPSTVFLSFNLSPHDLASPENMLRIVSIVEASGFAPQRINFEITETALIRDFDQAAQSVTLLRHLGAGVALDDFGTGYASLNYVHRLPLSKVKIDGSFVHQIDRRPASAKIIKSVLSLCHELGLGAIVEGVETAEELETLKGIDVRYVQGYHFSRPLTASAALQLVAPRVSDIALQSVG